MFVVEARVEISPPFLCLLYVCIARLCVLMPVSAGSPSFSLLWPLLLLFASRSFCASEELSQDMPCCILNHSTTWLKATTNIVSVCPSGLSRQRQDGGRGCVAQRAWKWPLG